MNCEHKFKHAGVYVLMTKSSHSNMSDLNLYDKSRQISNLFISNFMHVRFNNYKKIAL